MDIFTGKPQFLKEINSSMIEQLIYKQGPLSKPALAGITGLSLPTVNKLVDDLEKSGRVCQVGLSGKGAGRKAMLYGTNKDSGCLIVLYYHWGEFFCRIADITGMTLYDGVFPFDNATKDAAVQSTTSAIDEMLEKAKTEVKSIGIGVPGVVMPDGRLWGIPQISVWEGFNLAETIAASYDVDICVENDVKLSTVGYYRTHLIDKLDSIVYIYAGSGIGSGVIINKKLYRGSANFAGELGFMAPLTNERPKRDYILSGGYLETQLSWFANGGQGKFGGRVNGEEREILTNILGAASANYVALLNPDAIVFGGEAFDKPLIEDIYKQIRCYSPEESIPVIIYDSNSQSGIEGLILTCREDITSQMRLIQDVGV